MLHHSFPFSHSSGLIADRVNLRYFLTAGMMGNCLFSLTVIAVPSYMFVLAGSGVFVGLLGVAYYGKIHNITYFILVQIGVGIFEVGKMTGQPAYFVPLQIMVDTSVH